MSADPQQTTQARWGQLRPSQWGHFRPSFPSDATRCAYERVARCRGLADFRHYADTRYGRALGPMSAAAAVAEAAADPPTPPTLRYLQVLRRRKLIFAICLIVPVAAAVAYGLSKSPVYQGSAQVLLSRQNLANALTNTPDPSSQTNNFSQIVQTQASVARSPVVAQRVARAVPTGLTYKDVLANSSVEANANADILNFKAANGNKKLASRLANAYAREFVAFRRELDTTPLQGALAQLDRRLMDATAASSEQLISQLTTRDQELRTLIALQTSNATLTGPSVDAVKISPKPLKYVAFALFAGALLAVASAFALENLDTKVRSAKEVETTLGVPPLAYIPPPEKPYETGGVLMLRDPRTPAAEAFRTLRTSIEFSTLDRNVKTLMVTSAREQEGKSVTIANLAVTMARAGSHVIAVDLDLRRPTLAQKLNAEPGPGVTDVALGRAPLDDALTSVQLANGGRTSGGPRGSLRLLRCGSIPPDPGEFVHSPSVQEILDQLAQMADIVLIDAPPVLQVADAVALSPYVDAVFLVTRLPQLRRPALTALARTLQAVQCLVLGVAITGTSEHGDNGYGYEYAYAPVESSEKTAKDI
ncbi:MAG: polysaccharide biosynthesis tyrosine autokinase [Solirubrobacteraceae bacterium]